MNRDIGKHVEKFKEVLERAPIEHYKSKILLHAKQKWSAEEQQEFSRHALEHLPVAQRVEAYEFVLASQIYLDWAREGQWGKYQQVRFAQDAIKALPFSKSKPFAYLRQLDKHRAIVVAPEGIIEPFDNASLMFRTIKGPGRHDVKGMMRDSNSFPGNETAEKIYENSVSHPIVESADQIAISAYFCLQVANSSAIGSSLKAEARSAFKILHGSKKFLPETPIRLITIETAPAPAV